MSHSLGRDFRQRRWSPTRAIVLIYEQGANSFTEVSVFNGPLSNGELHPETLCKRHLTATDESLTCHT
jgi:hypothetical protein